MYVNHVCGKMTRAPFTGVGERASDLLGLIHTDVGGPFRTMIRNSERYVITFMMTLVDLDMWIS